MKTIKQGEKVAKIDFGGFSVDELIKVLKKNKTKLVKPKIEYEYKQLKSVYSSDDNKKIIFEFNNSSKFYFNLPDYKFYHFIDNKLFAKHPPEFLGFLLKDAACFCKSNWIKSFLMLLSSEYEYLSNWINSRRNKNILYYEHLSKQDYIQDVLNNVDDNDDYAPSALIVEMASDFNDIKKFNEKYEWYIKNLPSIDFNRKHEERFQHFEYAYTSKLKDIFIYTFENHQITLTSNIIDDIKELISFGYEPKRLIDYLFRDLRGQGISIYFDEELVYDEIDDNFNPIQTLIDYARMNMEMKREYDKYPRYLKSFHDITVKNYNLFKRKSASAKFQKVAKNFAKYEYKNDIYCVISPKISDDLITEGIKLNHCVASYIDDVVRQETCIMFLRKNCSKEAPLVTLEIRKNKIVQAKGKNNSSPRPDEIKFIEEYKSYLKQLN